MNEIQHWEFAAAGSGRRARQATRATKRRPSTVSGIRLYYDNVIKVLRGEAEPETDGREGLRSLELLIASYLSARDGRRVALPLEYLTVLAYGYHPTAIIDDGAHHRRRHAHLALGPRLRRRGDRTQLLARARMSTSATAYESATT